MDIEKIKKATSIIEEIKKLDDLVLSMGKKLNHISESGENCSISFEFKKEKVQPTEERTYFVSMMSSMMGREIAQEEKDIFKIEISDVFTMELFAFIYQAANKERELLVRKLEKI